MPLGEIILLDEDTKRLYCKFDFKYFLDRHIETERYRKEDIEVLYAAKSEELRRLKIMLKYSKRQGMYYLEGMIRKGHSGGFLPSFFYLDESRSSQFLDFAEVGRSWAHFDVWSKGKRRKITGTRIWDFVVKVGAILGYVLSMFKVLELIQ